MRKTNLLRLMLLFLVILSCLLLTVPAMTATLDGAWVYSENRQYSSSFPNPPNGGAPFHFMQAGVDVAGRASGTPPPVVDLATGTPPFTPSPYDLPFMGTLAGAQDVAADVFRDTTLGGSHQPPDGWEGTSYTFTLYSDGSKSTVTDTRVVDRSSADFQPLPIPVATVTANGDAHHPTITWNPVSGATHYRVLVLNLNCQDGREVLHNPLHVSDLLTTEQYTIPANVDVFEHVKTFAIWVQASQVTGATVDTVINRSSYFTRYSAVLDGLPSDNLQAANGWVEYIDPVTDPAWVSTVVAENLIEIDAASAETEVDYFWQWSRSVTGLRGLAATTSYQTTPTGDTGIGIRKHLGALDNGNFIRAEIRQQFYQGSTFFSYRVREYRDNNDGSITELRCIADGTIGNGWQSGEDYTLGLVEFDGDVTFFARGISGFCDFILVPIEGDLQPWSSSARLIGWLYQQDVEASTMSVQIKDVKLIMVDDLPALDDICDVNGDGQTGLEEAIHALRICAGEL